jgi:hypothetical protein
VRAHVRDGIPDPIPHFAIRQMRAVPMEQSPGFQWQTRSVTALLAIAVAVYVCIHRGNSLRKFSWHVSASVEMTNLANRLIKMAERGG